MSDKAGPQEARDIVAMLIRRARYCHKRVKECEGIDDLVVYKHMISMNSAQWAEAHNCAETARRMLYGHEL